MKSENFSKAQSEIVGAIMVVLVSIALVGVVYTYGLPLIIKRQDTARVERTEAAFDQKSINSLPSKIEAVANNRGEASINLDIDGLWKLNENEDSISFTMFSKVSKSAANLQINPWVSLSGADCNQPSISAGTLSVDRPSVVCTRADSINDGLNVTYKVYFRQLNGQGINYKIDLIKHESGATSSTGKTVRIVFADRTETQGQQTLITYKVKILFI